METAFLKSFVMVAESGSMAEAARRQNLTPAAVAQQIKALEKELSTALVMRAGQTVKPTESGHRLLERASDLIKQFDDLKVFIQDDTIAGELRLGAINSALHTLLPAMLARLAKAYPDLKIFIRSGLSHTLVEALKQDEIDAAICLHPPYTLPKSMRWKQLREEALVVLAPKKQAGQDPLHLLRTQPFIRYDRSLGGGKQADHYLQIKNITPKERFELSSILAIAMMVHEGLGVSLVPNIASPLTTGLDVTLIKIKDLSETRRFGVLWQNTSPRARLVTAFLEEATRSHKAPSHSVQATG